MPKNTWDVQRKFCQDYGGDLVVYNDLWEQVRRVAVTAGKLRPSVC
jgi:hypothetical protein